MTTGEDILRTRTTLAITQEEMARALSVTKRTLQLWEKGANIPSTKRDFIRNKLKEMLDAAGKSVLLESEKSHTASVPQGFIEAMKNLTEAHSEQTRQVTELIELLKQTLNGRKPTEQDT